VRSRSILCFTALTLLAGCARPSDPFAGKADGPTFDPIAFFSQDIKSWGVVESRSGAPEETVMTASHGHLEADGSLTMTQRLTFGDGTTQRRDWTLRKTGPGTFQGAANDMVGTAEGQVSGPMFHWTWTLRHSPADVAMEQWMYRLPDGTALIRTTVSKFGIILTEVTEHFSRA
jgi:hypothetical protein